MPNRIIKESICSSDSVEKLSWFEEVMFYRLIVNCDDYGRFDARSAILKSRLFPLKERLSHKDIENALQKLSDIGCVRLYSCDNKPYLYLTSWEAHQSIRAKKSKYPAPLPEDLQACESNCKQMISDDCNCPRNPIQSESNPNPNPNVSTEQIAPSPPPAIFLTLNTKEEYPVYREQVEDYKKTYSNVDVMQQLREMRGWLIANPAKRKTKAGIQRFISSWLSREQDKPRPKSSGDIKPDCEYSHKDDFLSGG